MAAVLDRTEYFLQCTKNCQQSGQHGPNDIIHKRKPNPSNATFSAGSAFLARELEQVENLIKLFVKEAKERSLYEDSGAVIASSTDSIKSRLEELQKTFAGLQKVINTANSTKQQRDHRQVIVGTLNSKFAKLTKKFKDNLEKRTKALTSRQAEQVKQFGVSKAQLSTQAKGRPHLFNPSKAKHLNPQGKSQKLFQKPKPQFQPARPPPPGPSSVARRRNIQSPLGAGFPSQHHPDPFQQDDEYEDKYNKSRGRKLQYDRSQNIQNRAVQAQHVEGIITELSQVFGKVATLVTEQGELVSRIDDNLDIANKEIQAGQSELLKYYNNLSKERALILKILAAVFAVMLLFIFVY